MRTPWRIALALTFAAHVGQAQATQERTITFNDALRIALSRNTTLKLAENAAAQADITVRQQRAQFLPTLSLSSNLTNSVGRNFNEGDGGIVNQATQSLNAGLTAGVTLYDGGRNLASLRQARLLDTASTQSAERARQTVVFTVASNYLALVTQTEQLRVQQENLAVQQATERQVDALVQAGSKPRSDLYAQQAAVANASYSVVSAKRALDLARVDLMETLQLDPAASWNFEAPIVTDTVSSGNDYKLDSLVALAYAERRDLASEVSRVGAASEAIRSAGASRWPSVSLSVGYNSGFSSSAAASLADQLAERRGGSVAIGVSIPIFDRGTTSLAMQQAAVAEDNARLSLANQKQSIALEIRRALLDLEAAREQLAAAQAQQAAADLAASTTEDRYRAGVSTLLELTQARASRLQAASAVVSARYNLVYQKTVMTYVTGGTDPMLAALGE